MLDFANIESYKENNRIEAKRAQGGLPRSLWETYSAFANTDGGIILLGVEELDDHTLRIAGLSDPEEIVRQFWNTVNNHQKVNVNILSDRNVRIVESGEKKLVVIEVPRADRRDKPVYLGTDPFAGAYRRNGEGDYHCTRDEVRSMMRDQTDMPQDTRVLSQLGMDVFDFESVKRYRLRMAAQRPGHVWEELEDQEFLLRVTAVGRGEDGGLHPTAAGLLMLGSEYEIVKEFPDYFLDYQEKIDENVRWTDRVISTSGDWSGNLFDFYFRVYNKIVQDIKVPFRIERGTERVDDTSVHTALREALANALIHADYHDRRGIVVEKKPREIRIANPGGMRIRVEDAISGGVSDPRNPVLIKMFNLIGIGERAGSGLPNIYAVWSRQGWSCPRLQEQFSPDRTVLTLSFEEFSDRGSTGTTAASGDKKTAIKNGDKKTAINRQRRELVVEYLKKSGTCKTADISQLLDLKPSRAREYLALLVREGLLESAGANRNRTYRLGSNNR